MTEPRKPDKVEKVGEEQEAPVTRAPSKTLQELERLQFDAVERTGFDPNS